MGILKYQGGNKLIAAKGDNIIATRAASAPNYKAQPNKVVKPAVWDKSGYEKYISDPNYVAAASRGNTKQQGIVDYYKSLPGSTGREGGEQFFQDVARDMGEVYSYDADATKADWIFDRKATDELAAKRKADAIAAQRQSDSARGFTPGFKYEDGQLYQRRQGKDTGKEHWEASNYNMAKMYAKKYGTDGLSSKEIVQQVKENPRAFASTWGTPQNIAQAQGIKIKENNMTNYRNGGRLLKYQTGNKVDSVNTYQITPKAVNGVQRTNTAVLTPGEVDPKQYQGLSEWQPAYDPNRPTQLDSKAKANAAIMAERNRRNQEIIKFRQGVQKKYGIDPNTMDINQTIDPNAVYPEDHKQAGQRMIPAEDLENFYKNLEWKNAYRRRAGFKEKQYYGSKEAEQQGYTPQTNIRDLNFGYRLTTGSQAPARKHKRGGVLLKKSQKGGKLTTKVEGYDGVVSETYGKWLTKQSKKRKNKRKKQGGGDGSLEELYKKELRVLNKAKRKAERKADSKTASYNCGGKSHKGGGVLLRKGQKGFVVKDNSVTKKNDKDYKKSQKDKEKRAKKSEKTYKKALKKQGSLDLNKIATIKR